MICATSSCATTVALEHCHEFGGHIWGTYSLTIGSCKVVQSSKLFRKIKAFVSEKILRYSRRIIFRRIFSTHISKYKAVTVHMQWNTEPKVKLLLLCLCCNKLQKITEKFINCQSTILFWKVILKYSTFITVLICLSVCVLNLHSRTLILTCNTLCCKR
jgi:hypothetical protein